MIVQAKLSGYASTDLIYTEILWFFQLLDGSSLKGPLFLFSLGCSEQVPEAMTTVNRVVKELGLSDTWGETKQVYNDAKPMGSLLPRSS